MGKRGGRQKPDATVPAVSLEPLPVDPPFLKGMLKLAKPRTWPADYALNHAHYVKGTAKK